MPKVASAHPVDDHEREQDEDSDSGEMGGRDVRVDSVEEVEPIPEISVDYIVVDPKGVQLRHSRAYVKNSKTGELVRVGPSCANMPEVSQCFLVESAQPLRFCPWGALPLFRGR